MKKRLFSRIKQGLAGLGVAIVAGPALAVTQIDYSGAVTSATTEVTGAVQAALPVGIIVLSATVGWALFKRFVR